MKVRVSEFSLDIDSERQRNKEAEKFNYIAGSTNKFNASIDVFLKCFVGDIAENPFVATRLK